MDNKIQPSLKDFIPLVVNSVFAIGITYVILFSWKIIPVSHSVLHAFWLVAVSSFLVVVLTLLRWVKKWPIAVTWFQLAYGITAMCAWRYTTIELVRYYKDEGVSTDIIAAILAAPVVPLTLAAVYACLKAYQNRFER